MNAGFRDGASDYLAQELRAELGRQRLSTRELARRMDVDQSWLHKRLTGVIPLRFGEVIEIAAHLEIPEEQLYALLRSAASAARNAGKAGNN
jgi:transcriptional regulator with XRE-family HTH domain